MPAKTAAAAAKPRDRRISVVEVADDEFVNSYGACFVAKVGSWESDKRSTRERAYADGEKHLADE